MNCQRVSGLNMMTGDEYGDLEHTTLEVMEKYMNNAKAFRKGITPQEMADYYTQWADSLKYEQVGEMLVLIHRMFYLSMFGYHFYIYLFLIDN